LEQVDRAWLYDNSGAIPRLVGEKQAGTVTIFKDALPSIIEAAGKLKPA
jgi:predicted ABC-type ATPase